MKPSLKVTAQKDSKTKQSRPMQNHPSVNNYKTSKNQTIDMPQKITKYPNKQIPKTSHPLVHSTPRHSPAMAIEKLR